MNKLTDSIKTAADSAKDGMETVKSRAADTGAAARQKASEALEKSKEAASRGVQNSRQIASKAAHKSTDTIDKNPLAMVVGGIALGAIIGALLPKSNREERILGGAGKKLNTKAREVASAAKQAGKDKIDTLGINKESAREQFRDLVSKATEAVKAAGQAAKDAASKGD
jgi:ElaB/YqjD/DUF883 family membrane-anchored ribosome-binding protein